MITNARTILQEKIKENKNKSAYVQSKISETGHEFKEIKKSNLSKKLKQSLSRLLYESKLDEIDNSILSKEENSLLKNIIYAIYKNQTKS